MWGVPASNPLAGQQFIVPRGRDEDAQLNLANVAGVVPPMRLSDHRGRNSWPLLSADRRTIIYINYAAGTLRTMAADGRRSPFDQAARQGMRSDHSGVMESC